MLIVMTLLSPPVLHHARNTKRAAVAVINIVQIPTTVMIMILKILIVFQRLVVQIAPLRQIIQLTNNQLLTLPQLHNKTNHRRKNTTIKATANNNLLHNQQVAILGHSLIKVRKVLAPSQTHNQFNLTLKIININLE
mgnify:CR=1 FL=1